MKKTIWILNMLLLINSAHASPKLVLDKDAIDEFNRRSPDAKILIQRKKSFLLQFGNIEENINKRAFTLKVNEPLFIVNDEKKYVHNIYDTKDKDWIIKKQKPSDISVITYQQKGVHELRCAIHPKMRVTINVK